MSGTETPTIVRAEYDGALRVDAQWNPIPGTTFFRVGVLQGDIVIAKGSGMGVEGSVTLSQPLVPGRIYQVAAVVDRAGDPGPWGTPMTLVVGRLGSPALCYDGARTVSVSWTLPSTDLVNAGAVNVRDTSTGSVITRALLFGTSGMLTLPAPLDPRGRYTLSASAAFGTSTGPPTVTPLVTIAPEMSAVVYDPEQKRVRVTFTGLPPDGCLGGAVLCANDQPVFRQVGSQGSVQIAVAEALDPAKAWTVRPFWIAERARGPLGPAAELAVVGPVIRDIRWEGSKLALRWENRPGPPYPTGARIEVTAAGEPVCGASVPDTASGAFLPGPPLPAASACTVTVANLRGVAQGASSAAVPVVAAGTVLESADFDGHTLTATWSDSPPPNATVATLLVTNGGATVAQARGGDGSAKVTVPLDPATAYTAALCWSAFPAPSRGPTGASARLISAAPTVSTVALHDGAVEATIVPPVRTAGISRYVAVLEQYGVVIAHSAPVEAGVAPVAAIPYAGGIDDVGLAVRAQGIGPPTGVRVSGPLGPSTPVVAVAPSIRSARLDGTTLTVVWTHPDAPPGAVTGTTLVVTPSRGQPSIFPALHGTSAQVTLPSALIEPTVLLTLSATATGPAGSSPATRIPLVSALPSIVSADWDGRRLSASWAWPQGALAATVATAYRLSIVNADKPVGSIVLTGTTGVLTPTAALDPTARTTVRVDALVGVSECLASTGPELPTEAPLLESAVVNGDSVTLTWTGPTAPVGVVTSLQGVFTSPGHASRTAAIDTVRPSPAIPTIASDPLVPLFVAIRATGTDTSGPISNRLPVLCGRPVITGVRGYADGSAEVSWTPVPCAVHTYLATLYKNGTVVSTVAVAGTTARLAPGAIDPNADHAVGVRARDGAAAGPESVHVPVVLMPPALAQPAFDGRSLSVAVTAVGAPDHYATALLRDGTEISRATVPAPVGHARLSLPVFGPFDPAAAYTLAVSAIAGASTSPAASVAVLLTTPVVTSVACGSRLVVAVGHAAPGTPGSTLTAGLWVKGIQIATQAVGRDGTAAFDLPGSGPVAVAAQAGADGATGPWSDLVPALTTTPTITAACHDGARLELSWSPPGRTRVTVTGAGTVAEVDVCGSSATLPLAAEAGVAYTVTLVQHTGVAVGPPATLPLVTGAPTPTLAADPSGSFVTATFTAPPGTSALVPVLKEGEVTTAQTEIGAVSPARISLPSETPAGAALALRARAGAALGPTSGFAPIVLGSPVDVVLRFEAGVLTAVWKGPGDPRVDGAIVTLTAPDRPLQRFRVHGESWSHALDPMPAEAAVTIAATAGAGSGPPTSALPVLLTSPVITAVTFDDPGLTAIWSAPSGGPAPSGYVVTVSNPQGVLARHAVTTTTAFVTVPQGTRGELSVTVAPTLGAVIGPASAPATALTSSPSVTGVAVDPLTGAATVAFTPVVNPPVDGYTVQLYREGEPLGAPQQTVTTTATLPPDAITGQWALSVAVRAHALSTVALTGPYGPAAHVLTAQPALRASDYDGVSAALTWDGTGQDDGGYRASVVANGRHLPAATVDAGADARTLRFPVTLPDTTADWQLVLQVRRGRSTGPPVTRPLFTPGIYLRSDGQPRVFRASTLAPAPAATTAYLPDIGPLGSLPIPPGGGTDAPALQITANPDRAHSTAFPYLLKIGGAALDFSEAAAVRTAVWSAYTALLSGAEDAGATPWGIVQLQQLVSRLMPQTFAETLLYAYGLDPAGSSADLRPGLVLRVASADFDQVSSNRPPAYASGYTNGSALDYEVDDYVDSATQPDKADWLLGFDPFLSWLTANHVVTVPAPESTGGLQSGAAEALDLYHPAFRQPFYRLFFPAQTQPTTPPAEALTTRQFTLAAAATHRAISTATLTPSPNVAVAYFRGRGVLKLAIPVVVDGVRQLVPVGTTVGNLLDRLARRPPRAATELLGVALERGLGPAVLDPTRYDAGAYERVRLDYGGLQTFDRRDALSLPLLHGDRLTLGVRP